MKREIALAVVVGALAGLAGAWSARRSAAEPPAEPAEAVAAPAPEEAAVQAGLGARVVPAGNALPALLRVQVKPPSTVPLRLARWSLKAGKGSDGDWLELPAQRTDEKGRAELPLERGTYWVGAGVVHAQVELATVTDLELELTRGFPFAGRVLAAEGGRPIPNALVVAMPGRDAPESEKISAQSDGLGRFMFEGLPKGEITLDVTASGWASRQLHAETPARGVFDVHLDESCRVDGVVLDGEGASVGGAGEKDPATIASEGGRFWLELPCGVGHTLIARDAKGRIGLAKLEPRQKRVTLRLDDGLSLKGTVHGPSGEPVAGAEVAAMIGDDEVRARVVSDERGMFTLSPLSPASYVVRARKGRGTTGALYGIEVPAEAPVDLVVQPGAVLEGEVLGADDPIAVEVTWSALRQERPARTRTLGGRFRFDDLPAGAARLKASAEGRVKEQAVFLEAGASASVRLELEQLGRIVGKVLGPNAAGAQVAAHRIGGDDGLPRSVNADDEGNFVLEVPAGEYSVGAASARRAMMRFEADATVVAGQDVQVEVHIGAADDGGSGWGPMASVARGELGASFENVNGGVQISWVVADSPISAAGLKVGDVLTAIDGKPVSSALDAFARSRGVPGSAVAIAWLREGVPHTVTLSRAP